MGPPPKAAAGWGERGVRVACSPCAGSLDVCKRNAGRRTVGFMMRVIRAIGRWLRNVGRDVVSGSGPRSLGSGGERFREQSMVQEILNKDR